jgi:hypothetical protein
MTDTKYLIVVVSSTDGKPALEGVYEADNAVTAGAVAANFDAAALEWATFIGGYPDRAYLIKEGDVQDIDALRTLTAEKLGDHG